MIKSRTKAKSISELVTCPPSVTCVQILFVIEGPSAHG